MADVYTFGSVRGYIYVQDELSSRWKIQFFLPVCGGLRGGRGICCDSKYLCLIGGEGNKNLSLFFFQSFFVSSKKHVIFYIHMTIHILVFMGHGLDGKLSSL